MPWGRILSSHGILIVRPLWVYLPALKWHQVPSSGHETKRHPGDRWDGEWRHPLHSKYLFEGELMRPDLKMVVNACNTMESFQFIVYMYISLMHVQYLQYFFCFQIGEFIWIHQSSPIRKLIGVECICWFNFVYPERHLGSARRCLPKIPRDLRVDNSMFLRKLRPCNSGNPNVRRQN